MEGESAVRVRVRAGLVGPGPAAVRHAGRLVGHLECRRRSMAPAAHERGPHVSIFQPQYEGWDHDRLSGRAAVVVENPVSAGAAVRGDQVHRTDRGRQGVSHRHARGRDHHEGRTSRRRQRAGPSYLAALRQALSAQPLTIALDAPRIIVLRASRLCSPDRRTDILEVTNTDDDLFLYTPQQGVYALLSGRWFRAGSLQGPWEFVASGDLPPDFARIGGHR